jgi:Spy/CpxP family protein refolding chaperone
VKQYWVVWILLAVSPAVSQILPGGLGNRWWRAPQMVEKLGLTPEQQRKMDDVFQQNRVKLIDLTASLDKEEAILEPLVSAEQPDADKIRAQVSRVADARSELEKANANMLLGLRLLLTPDQWKSLQAAAAKPRPRKLANQDDAPVPRKLR